jgi:hypothetical protein
MLFFWGVMPKQSQVLSDKSYSTVTAQNYTDLRVLGS